MALLTLLWLYLLTPARLTDCGSLYDYGSKLTAATRSLGAPPGEGSAAAPRWSDPATACNGTCNRMYVMRPKGAGSGAHLRQRAPFDEHERGNLASATHGRRALQRLDPPLAVRVAALRRVVRLVVGLVGGVSRLAVAARWCLWCSAPTSDAAGGDARLLGGVGLPRRGGGALSRGGRRPRVTAAAASAPHLGHAASTVTRLLTAGLVGLRSVPIIAGAALAWPLGARGATSGAAVHLVLAELLTEVTERSRASSADSRRSSGHKSLERDPLTGVYPSLPRAEPRPTGPSRTSLPLWPLRMRAPDISCPLRSRHTDRLGHCARARAARDAAPGVERAAAVRGACGVSGRGVAINLSMPCHLRAVA